MTNTKNTNLDVLFAALSDRTRRAILSMLLEGDKTVRHLAQPFDTSLAAISKHIQILVKSGLVTQSKSGREKWCRLDPSALKPATIWIESYGLYLDEDFDRLEQMLEDQGILLDETS